MANRDIIILNTTQSRAETQQASDTVRIKGGGEILSIENSSASPILTVQSSGSQTTLSGKITSTGNLTGVITGSFGRVEGTTLIGSAFELTNTDLPNTLSSSAQIASYITGSFRDGFEFTGTISGSGGSTGSFDRIVATTFVGDANNLGKSSEIPNTVSASSMIASDISGSFTSGFEFSSGNISGSSTTTGSFGRIEATTITGDGFELTNIAKTGTITSSAQLASRISGSFNKGFEFTNKISGSATSTGSFGKIVATTLVGDVSNMTNTIKPGTISSSAQLATRISGSFNKGFEFDGEISASISGSASFTTLTAQTLVGDGAALTNTIPTGTISGSAQVADRISGSFNKGFIYDGEISGSVTSTGSFGQVKALQFVGSGANITNFTKPSNIHSGSAQFTGISGSFTSGFEFVGTISGSVTSTGSFGQIVATTFAGDGSNLTNTALTGTVSGSAQLASNISGSFNKGFEYTGEIRTAKGVWSAGGNLNTAKRHTAGAGIQNAGLSTGGQINTNNSNAVNESEEYDGTSWTEGGNLITARRDHSGVGTQNAALLYGGYNTKTETEEYNGTSYATAGALSQGGYNKVGFGIQNAAFSTAGVHSDYNGIRAESEQYDGAVWSNSISMILPRTGGGAGSVNAGIKSYGFRALPARAQNCTELWNGTSWSETSEAVTTGESDVEYGTQNAFAVTAGAAGAPGYAHRKTTQFFDGTAYSVDGNLSVSGYGRGGARTSQDSGLVFGGMNPSFLTATEEYNAYYTTGSFGRIETPDVQIVQDSQLVVSSSLQLPVFATNEGIVSSSAGQMWFNSTTRKLNFTMDVNSWSAGGALLIDRRGAANVGTTNAALSAGGFELGAATVTGSVEQYNGSTWSVAAKMIDVKGEGVGIGTQNSALIAGGAPATGKQLVEFYNGTAWSEKADLIATHASGSGGAGTANAGIVFGGVGIALSEEFNGTAWTEGNDLIDARGYGASGGFQNSAWYAGGTANTVASTEHYDGTSWSEVSDLITARTGLGGAGTQNAGLAFGGTFCNHTEEFNGTSWSEGNNLIQARTHLGQASAGNQSSALAIGGHTPSPAANTTLTCTEEYTVTHLKTIEIDGV